LIAILLAVLIACTPDENETKPTFEATPPTDADGVDIRDGPIPLTSIDEMLPMHFDRLADHWIGDLDGMSDRHVIRVLVISGSPQFFYSEGKPRGMIVELLGRFQERINQELGRGLHAVEVIPMPVSRDRLIPALLSGQADLIAADLTKTEIRSALVDFSQPFIRDVDEVVIFGPTSATDVESLDDLAGSSIYVRASSSYFEHLVALNAEFEERGLNPIRIELANELLRTQDILEMVNAGLIRATVVDQYKADYWAKIFPEIRIRHDLIVNHGGDIAWVFRKESPLLADAVNEFVRRNRQGTLIGNILIKRYLENIQRVRNATSEDGIARLQPTLDLFQASAETVNLDPLMLVAQAYQESELDHDKRSSAGAVGIMQVKPSTAADKNVGIDDISSRADNIRAGAIYMRFLMDRYFSDEGIDAVQQWFFALAAYNAGPARIQRIRRQAAAEGHDPNLWFENVELVAARKLGRETVRYVRNVFKYYVAYRMTWKARESRESIGKLEKARRAG